MKASKEGLWLRVKGRKFQICTAEKLLAAKILFEEVSSLFCGEPVQLIEKGFWHVLLYGNEIEAIKF